MKVAPEKIGRNLGKLIWVCNSTSLETTVFHLDIQEYVSRNNDQIHKDKITEAQTLIFRHRASLNGVGVQSILAEESLVAVNVCHSSLQTT